MADIKLFSLSGGVNELASGTVMLEKELQTTIEQNMAAFFGVTFLRSEYAISNGRIDSLGLDENYCPVIFEYKRSTNENVINQGLFYLDWLLDHKADFKLLVMETLGMDATAKLDWSMPQVICIANDFTKFDEHAVNQMQRNIKLVRYKKFGKDLILFEHLNTPNVKPIADASGSAVPVERGSATQKTFTQQFISAGEGMRNLYLSIKGYILSLGDDITENELKLYVAFKKVKNIACVEIYQSKILINMPLNPSTVTLQKDFLRNMTGIGHYGTGTVQLIIRTVEDYEKAKPYLERAYHEG